MMDSLLKDSHDKKNETEDSQSMIVSQNEKLNRLENKVDLLGRIGELVPFRAQIFILQGVQLLVRVHN